MVVDSRYRIGTGPLSQLSVPIGTSVLFPSDTLKVIVGSLLVPSHYYLEAYHVC